MVIITLDGKPYGVAELHSAAWELATEAMASVAAPTDWTGITPGHTVECRPVEPGDDLTGVKKRG